MKKFLLSLLFSCSLIGQTNVQKGVGNLLSNGSIVVGANTTISTTGNGQIIATGAQAVSGSIFDLSLGTVTLPSYIRIPTAVGNNGLVLQSNGTTWLAAAVSPSFSGLTTNGLLQATDATHVASTLTPAGLTSLGVNSITAGAATDLLLSGGSNGANLRLGQGVNGVAQFNGNAVLGGSVADLFSFGAGQYLGITSNVSQTYLQLNSAAGQNVGVAFGINGVRQVQYDVDAATGDLRFFTGGASIADRMHLTNAGDLKLLTGKLIKNDVAVLGDSGDNDRLIIQPITAGNSTNVSLSPKNPIGSAGGNAFEVYLTDFVADRTNNETLRVLGDIQNSRFEIGPRQGGTGVLRPFYLSADTKPANFPTAPNILIQASGISINNSALTVGGTLTAGSGLVVITNSTGNLLASALTGTVAAAQMPAFTGDITTSAGAVATTLATVNSNVGTFGSATVAPVVTLDGKGRATAASNVTITPAVGSITGLGTGVGAALAVNVGSTGAPVINGGALGTPSSATLTSATGLPISTGVSGLGSGTATALAAAANGSGGFVTDTGTVTLTNKRITARITTITSNATPTVNTDNCDCVTITALAAAITSMTTNLSGTPVNFDQLEYRVKDDGTARAITWGASFVSGPATLPTTTTISKALHVWFEWDSVQSKWVCLSTGSDA